MRDDEYLCSDIPCTSPSHLDSASASPNGDEWQSIRKTRSPRRLCLQRINLPLGFVPVLLELKRRLGSFDAACFLVPISRHSLRLRAPTTEHWSSKVVLGAVRARPTKRVHENRGSTACSFVLHWRSSSPLKIQSDILEPFLPSTLRLPAEERSVSTAEKRAHRSAEIGRPAGPT